MDKLKQSTIEYILKCLKEQREDKRYTMIHSIESNYSEENIKTRVKEYQEIHEVYCEFDDWVDAMEVE